MSFRMRASIGMLFLLPMALQAFVGAPAHKSPTTRSSLFTSLSSSSSSSSSGQGRIPIALTREDGKNGKLLKQLQEHPRLADQLELLELPCIAHADGADYGQLQSTLLEGDWDYVAVTSPEAAKVVASAWRPDVQTKSIEVVAVGKATGTMLESLGIPVSFCPSIATAETLAEELEYKGEGTSLLYPASAKAKNVLQDGLEARGFAVTRLNTYDTVTATWSQDEQALARSVQIACFASPSSVKGWLKNTNDNKEVIAACIGITSAKACRGHGWEEGRIFYPEAPGLEGWVEAIEEALQDVRNISHV